MWGISAAPRGALWKFHVNSPNLITRGGLRSWLVNPNQLSPHRCYKHTLARTQTYTNTLRYKHTLTRTQILQENTIANYRKLFHVNVISIVVSCNLPYIPAQASTTFKLHFCVTCKRITCVANRVSPLCWCQKSKWFPWKHFNLPGGRW